jgi:hypothetical protein
MVSGQVKLAWLSMAISPLIGARPLTSSPALLFSGLPRLSILTMERGCRRVEGSSAG